MCTDWPGGQDKWLYTKLCSPMSTWIFPHVLFSPLLPMLLRNLMDRMDGFALSSVLQWVPGYFLMCCLALLRILLRNLMVGLKDSSAVLHELLSDLPPCAVYSTVYIHMLLRNRNLMIYKDQIITHTIFTLHITRPIVIQVPSLTSSQRTG